MSGGELTSDLCALGLPEGADVLVHCSTRLLGHTPADLLAALRATVGTQGTVVVPTYTSNNSTTSPAWFEATRGMSDAAVAAYERHLPGFDPAVTPSFQMGAFAEYVRTRPDAIRSRHPQTSFAAVGGGAAAITAIHDLDSHLGERSPLAALYARGGYVALIGVGYAACTVFHLAEYRMAVPPPIRPYRCFVIDADRRKTVDFQALHLDDTDFAALGADLEREPVERAGQVGNTLSRVVSIRHAVDFAVQWFDKHRTR